MTTPATPPADCKHPPGTFEPVIDRNRCEGREDCRAVCPYGVFTIGVLPAADRRTLSWRGKIKGFAHGWKQSFATNAEACHGCTRCVTACPERAISMRRVDNGR